MTNDSLRNLFRKGREMGPLVALVTGAFEGAPVRIETLDGRLLWGEASEATDHRCSIVVGGDRVGWVSGPPASAAVVAALVEHLAAREAERRTLANEVLQLYREVNLIYSFSEELASTLDLDRVAQVTLEQARHLIDATDGAVLLLDEGTGRLQATAAFGEAYRASLGAICPEGLFASVLASGQGDIVNDVGADTRSVQGASRVASVICTPLRVKERVSGLLTLSSAEPVCYTAADLKLLNTLALQTASAIENARLFERTLQAARDRERLAALHKELDVASRIQRAIVPSQSPPFPGREEFGIRASMTPARAVGGDFYDFFTIDEEHLGFVIADVSGKGVPSALFMAVCRTLIKSTAQSVYEPHECLARVNRVLASEGVPSMYVTVFYGVLDTRNGEVTYCNAGHNPPFVLRNDGSVEMVAQTGGTVVGLFEMTPYEAGHLALQPGDTIFTYTDGVTEACNAEGEEYTTSRLQPCLGSCRGLDLEPLLASVRQDLAAFVGGAPQGDDITMMAVRYRGTEIAETGRPPAGR